MESQLARLSRAVEQEKFQRSNARRGDLYRARVITIASGKGGVGKTTFAVNLASTLASFKKDYKILLLDADWGMANAHLVLGEKPRYHIEKVLAGELSLERIIHKTKYGFDLISGGNGISRLLSLSGREQEQIEQEWTRLEQHGDYDLMIIDCGAGGSVLVQNLLIFSDEAIIVTQGETTALTDAYSLLKAVAGRMKKMEHESRMRLSIVVNAAQKLDLGLVAGEKLVATTKKYLSLKAHVLGVLAEEPAMRASMFRQGFYIVDMPYSALATSMRKLSLQLLEYDEEKGAKAYESYRLPSGRGLRGFFNKIFQGNA